MGTIFVRGSKLWLRYKSASGKWTKKAAGLPVGQEAKAEKLLEKNEANIRARIEAGDTEADGPITVRQFANRWLKRRTTTTATDDQGRLNHALPAIGALQLEEVRPRHIRELVRSLANDRKKDLAPRTVRHVYGLLHTMFHDAVVDELIDANPCILKRGDLPKKVDADPAWRPSAVFTRAEVEALISDERIPKIAGPSTPSSDSPGFVSARRLRSPGRSTTRR